jgi:hypothetical protein
VENNSVLRESETTKIEMNRTSGVTSKRKGRKRSLLGQKYIHERKSVAKSQRLFYRCVSIQ